LRKRAMLVLLAMGAALLMAGGVAWAATFTCDQTGDRDPDPGQCSGTPNPDEINGTPGTDEIRALAGNDVVSGFDGSDEIYGDEGNDVVDGWPGNDTIYGGPDDDGSAQGTGFDFQNLQGAEGSDTVYGNGGNDWIDAAQNDSPGSEDSSFGGSGNDRIGAVDGNVDIINCGKGTRDRAFIDSLDVEVTGCERITAPVE